ncbi:MAG: hypothetical protein HYZ23_05795 [Chloroflexi bacterium]|nr:hypothetical protein [Chloroflexota bacterium]
MPAKKSFVPFFAAFLTIVQLACNLGVNPATPDTFATLNGLYTASALTQGAGSPQPILTSTPGLPLPTSTPLPPAAATTTATNPPLVASPVPTSRCDAIQFLGDVTYPDGSPVMRGSSFVKTWKIKNTGECAWTTSYALVFSSGDSMNGPSAVNLERKVNPGETIEVSAKLTAPNKDGHYRGYWKLRNGNGMLFGFGEDADTAFWVDVNVIGEEFVAYSFVKRYCEADWGNEDGALPCPGKEGDAKGFVIKLDKPTLENGVKKEVPSLLTVPQDVRDGLIGGIYPAFTVQTGDRFRAIINCQYNSEKCNVIFHLAYQKKGEIVTLATWHEAYEGQYYAIDFDLSALAGQTVKFILMVSANGGQKQDNALWLDPHILRQGRPTPTPTPTVTPRATPSG